MSAFEQHFSVASLKPLVIGRGPVRLEALEVFAAQGMTAMGMLLSRKDAYGTAYGQAPELRALPQGCRVHLVADYMPVGSKSVFIDEIVSLCKANGYNSVFAGYGFLAEDPALAAAVEAAGLYFIGPAASVSRQAGAKDAAKQTAISVGAAVVPGENSLLGKAYLLQCLHEAGRADIAGFDDELVVSWQVCENSVSSRDLPDEALTSVDALAQVLQGWLERQPQGFGLLQPPMICRAAALVMTQLWRAYPEHNLRLKAVHGGGGKGQRVLSRSADQALIAETLQAIWTEVGAHDEAANKNCVIELDIAETRHWEIQLVGNGQWCVALGGRDCSLQRFEQKLVEFSLTSAGLPPGHGDQAILTQLEHDAIAFGEAVGLNSVSTYEAIVSGDRHFFMEVNTRLQVEHRVTELVYGLAFDGADGSILQVDSLVHLMCLLALHGPRLPKPRRVTKANASLEVRINGMNNALKPAVGGLLQSWSPPVAGEIRDDQGLSRPNPDSGLPMSYAIAGAYDSNLALSLVTGTSRADTIDKMLQVLSCMRLWGRGVETNIPVLIGVLAVLKHSPDHVFATGWLKLYLNLAACVQERLLAEDLPCNPHQVIAYLLEGEPSMLAVNPDRLTAAQLQALREIAGQLDLQAAVQAGALERFQPGQTAEQILDPPPAMDDCLIKAPSGGVYYAQPAPTQPAFVAVDQLVRQGQTIGIIEVMKMFNPVLAPQDLIVREILLENGASVKKGTPLLSFEPVY